MSEFKSKAAKDADGRCMSHVEVAIVQAEYRKFLESEITALRSANAHLAKYARRLEGESLAVRDALFWYAEKAGHCRKITDTGEEARNALDGDGGERGRVALASTAETADRVRRGVQANAVIRAIGLYQYGMEPEDLIGEQKELAQQLRGQNAGGAQ